MTPKILLLGLIILFTLQFSQKDERPINDQINAIIGNVSFKDKFDRLPNSSDSEELRIATHLEYVTQILQKEDVTHLNNLQAQKRAHLITLLKEYTHQREFPKNYHFSEKRTPVFIDRDGNICAVGYLVQQTKGDEAAEQINDQYKFGYILDMESEFLENWLTEYGLSKKEAAMIQPAYDPVEPIETTVIVDNDLRADYIIASGGLAAFQAYFSAMSYSPKSSVKARAPLSTISAGLGAASIGLGLYHLRRSKSKEGGICLYSCHEIERINESKRNLSYVNIAFGTASTLFNTYRAVQLYRKAREESITMHSNIEYLPGISEPIPTIGLNYHF